MAEQCSGCRRAIPPGGRGFLFGDKGRALCSSCGAIYCLDCFDTLTKSPMRWHRPPEWFSLFFFIRDRDCRECGRRVGDPVQFLGG